MNGNNIHSKYGKDPELNYSAKTWEMNQDEERTFTHVGNVLSSIYH